jgi:hypothetical protein
MMHNSGMRTTLEIDDEVLKKVKKMAGRTGKTLGETASRLLEFGLERASENPIRYEGKIPVIQTPAAVEPPDLLDLVRRWKEKG